MPPNFTPLPKTVSGRESGVNVNMILIIIALVITILLGALMWFLVIQKQQEEDRANSAIKNTTPKTIEATVEESETPAVASPSSTITP